MMDKSNGIDLQKGKIISIIVFFVFLFLTSNGFAYAEEGCLDFIITYDDFEICDGESRNTLSFSYYFDCPLAYDFCRITKVENTACVNTDNNAVGEKLEVNLYAGSGYGGLCLSDPSGDCDGVFWETWTASIDLYDVIKEPGEPSLKITQDWKFYADVCGIVDYQASRACKNAEMNILSTAAPSSCRPGALPCPAPHHPQ